MNENIAVLPSFFKPIGIIFFLFGVIIPSHLLGETDGSEFTQGTILMNENPRPNLVFRDDKYKWFDTAETKSEMRETRDTLEPNGERETKTIRIVKKKKTIQKDTSILTGFFTIINQDNVQLKLKLQPSEEQFKMIVMMVGKTSADIHPLNKGVKLSFVAGFETQICTFNYRLGGLTDNGMPAYINAFLIEKNRLNWYRKNVVTQLILENPITKKKYAYAIAKKEQKAWLQYLNDFFYKKKK